MIRALALFALMAPAAVSAETLVTPDAFEALSTGHTLYFSRDGAQYGVEQFHGNRASTWQYADGSCTEGKWFADGDAICFVYETAPDPQCWVFSKRSGDYFARLRGTAPGDASELRMTGKDMTPIPCLGPDVGV